MTKQEARKIAEAADENLKACVIEDPSDEVGYDLYDFVLDGQQLNVFAYIHKAFDREYNERWFSVYAGVEYEGGDTIYADYDHSTEHLDVKELTDAIFEIGNLYAREEALNDLRKMI